MRTFFSDCAPNRNPCASSFREVDRRITEDQYEAMNNIDLYVGIDSYYVNDDKTVTVYSYGEYYATIKRDGTMSVSADSFVTTGNDKPVPLGLRIVTPQYAWSDEERDWSDPDAGRINPE